MNRPALEALRDTLRARDWNVDSVGPMELYALLDALLAPDPARAQAPRDYAKEPRTCWCCGKEFSGESLTGKCRDCVLYPSQHPCRYPHNLELLRPPKMTDYAKEPQPAAQGMPGAEPTVYERDAPESA